MTNYKITNVGFGVENFTKLAPNKYLMQGTIYGEEIAQDNTKTETCNDFEFIYNTQTQNIDITKLEDFFTKKEFIEIKEILLDNLLTNFKGE